MATQILISKRQYKTLDLTSPVLWNKLTRGDATISDLVKQSKNVTSLLQKPNATFDHQLGLTLMTMVSQLRSLDDSSEKIELKIY